jgi:transcriptional regulator with XRE-family HTH domain
LVDVGDAHTIGARLRLIRNSRQKSLRVVAGLASMSKSRLSEIERGECVLDSISEIVALANALRIAPSELTRLPVPAPTNGETDSAVEAVRSALMAVGRNRPDGQVVPLDVLRARVTGMLSAHYSCRQDHEVGAALQGLIRDLHTSIAAGRDVVRLLELAMLLHTAATLGWLRLAGAQLDLREQAAQLVHQTAQHHGTPTALGLATWGGLHVMLWASVHQRRVLAPSRDARGSRL